MKTNKSTFHFIFLILVHALILICKENNAQNYIMKSPINADERFKFISQIDSNHVIVMSRQNNGINNYLKKINTLTGNIVWSINLLNSDPNFQNLPLTSMLVLDDNTILLAGAYTRFNSLTNTNVNGNILLHLDQMGDTLKTHAFEPAVTGNLRLFIKPNGETAYAFEYNGVIEFGNVNVTNLTINPIARYPSLYSSGINDIKTIGGKIFVMCAKYEFYILNDAFSLLNHKIIDGLGSLGENALRVFEDSNNNYVIVGSTGETIGVFIKLNLGLTIIQQKYIGLTTNVSIRDVLKDADDNYYILGSFGTAIQSSTYDALAFKLDSNGDTLVTKYFGVTGTSDNLALGVLMNNSLIWMTGASDNLGYQLYIKTDLNLTFGCNHLVKSSGISALTGLTINNASTTSSSLPSYSYLHISPVINNFPYSLTLICGINGNSNHNIDVKEFDIYPNPTNGMIQMNLDRSIQKIIVYNILGNTVNQIDYPESDIDLSLLPNGLYTIEILDTYGKYGRKKVIKL